MVDRTLSKNQLLLALAILNILVIAIMQSFAPALKPFSIIGFEFAGTPEQAQLMVNTWKQNGVLHSVYFLIGFDYLFMITYASFLWLVCIRAAIGMSGKWAKVITILAWLQPVAGLLDAIENLSLYQMVTGSLKPLWPTLSVICAAPKFAIALTGLAVLLVSSFIQIMRWKKITT